MDSFREIIKFNNVAEVQQFVEQALVQMGLRNVRRIAELQWSIEGTDDDILRSTYELYVTSDFKTFYLEHSNSDAGPQLRFYRTASVFTVESFYFKPFQETLAEIIKTYPPNHYGLT